MTDEGFKNLKYAIVRQAVNDYKSLLKRQTQPTGNKNIRELERFFKSEWFQILAGELICGEKLMAEVRRQVDEWQVKRTLKTG